MTITSGWVHILLVVFKTTLLPADATKNIALESPLYAKVTVLKGLVSKLSHNIMNWIIVINGRSKRISMPNSPLSLAYRFLFSFPDFGFTSSMVFIPISKGKFHCQILLTLQHIFDSPIVDQPDPKVSCLGPETETMSDWSQVNVMLFNTHVFFFFLSTKTYLSMLSPRKST